MRAIVMNAYGGSEVLELREVNVPAVGDSDVLVRVSAAALNAGDYFMMRGSPWLARLSVGFPRPRNHILGWDVAGFVEEVGSKVTQFKAGDAVFGSCDSTLAEFACATETKFIPVPTNITIEEAAAVPSAASTALQALRDQMKVESGQHLLINGASGGVGTFSVQIAKAFGAEVTAVCSTRNKDMLLSLGADHVIDYTREDFTLGDPCYDHILDNVGNHSFSHIRRVLLPGGTHLPNTGHAGMSFVLKAFALSMFMHQHAHPFLAVPTADDMKTLKNLIETGKLEAVIDRVYPLEQTPDAMRYLEEEHAQGKVVVTM